MKKFFPGRKHISILTYSFLFISFFFWNVDKSLAICSKGTCSGSGVSCQIIGSSNSRYESNILNFCCDTTAECDAEKNLESCTETAQGIHQTSCTVAVDDEKNKVSTTKTYFCLSQMSCTQFRSQQNNKLNARDPVTVCTYAGDKEGDCNSCLSSKGIWTALGCIPFNQDEFVISVVKIIMGAAGLITLAMMLVATVMLMTGGGNSEQMKRGKEIFTGAVVGLLFLIFSVVILQIITKDIIKIDIMENAPTNTIPRQQPI